MSSPRVRMISLMLKFTEVPCCSKNSLSNLTQNLGTQRLVGNIFCPFLTSLGSTKIVSWTTKLLNICLNVFHQMSYLGHPGNHPGNHPGDHPGDYSDDYSDDPTTLTIPSYHETPCIQFLRQGQSRRVDREEVDVMWKLQLRTKQKRSLRRTSKLIQKMKLTWQISVTWKIMLFKLELEKIQLIIICAEEGQRPDYAVDW